MPYIRSACFWLGGLITKYLPRPILPHPFHYLLTFGLSLHILHGFVGTCHYSCFLAIFWKTCTLRAHNTWIDQTLLLKLTNFGGASYYGGRVQKGLNKLNRLAVQLGMWIKWSGAEWKPFSFTKDETIIIYILQRIQFFLAQRQSLTKIFLCANMMPTHFWQKNLRRC